VVLDQADALPVTDVSNDSAWSACFPAYLRFFNYVSNGQNIVKGLPYSNNDRKRDVAAEAFCKAIEDLKKELSIADETTAWADTHAGVHTILETVHRAKKKYHDASKDHSGTRAWLEKFSGRVMYYGKVFDALAQHHPEYVALAWGAVKFVLMVWHLCLLAC
jgi:hypothetical protein